MNNTIDELDGLDVSWILEQKRINSVELSQKREPMQKINLCFIYINQNNYIQDVSHDVEVLDKSRISNQRMLHIIQSKKLKTHTSKFNLADILLYNIDLEPELFQHYDFTTSFLKPVSVINDIKVPDSVFIFHNINNLYFIFKEVEIKHTISNKTQSLKSILKPVSVIGTGSLTHTKKVRISLANQTTRKVLSKECA